MYHHPHFSEGEKSLQSLDDLPKITQLMVDRTHPLTLSPPAFWEPCGFWALGEDRSLGQFHISDCIKLTTGAFRMQSIMQDKHWCFL